MTLDQLFHPLLLLSCILNLLHLYRFISLFLCYLMHQLNLFLLNPLQPPYHILLLDFYHPLLLLQPLHSHFLFFLEFQHLTLIADLNLSIFYQFLDSMVNRQYKPIPMLLEIVEIGRAMVEIGVD